MESKIDLGAIWTKNVATEKIVLDIFSNVANYCANSLSCHLPV